MRSRFGRDLVSEIKMEGDGGQLTLVSASAHAQTCACTPAHICAGTAGPYREARGRSLYHSRSWEVKVKSGSQVALPTPSTPGSDPLGACAGSGVNGWGL